MKKIWGMEAALECRMPERSLADMLREVEAYVR